MYVVVKPGAGGPAFLRYLFAWVIRYDVNEVKIKYLKLNKKTGLYIIDVKYLRSTWKDNISKSFWSENTVFTADNIEIVNGEVEEIIIRRKIVEVDEWTKPEVLEICRDNECKELPLGPGAYRYLKSRVSQ